ncbi:Extracellular ribonuclease [Kordia antarctica]|uniref:Extracellular ribonuclease n=1 Tax=Kordia antarctica TaxID=1218801 RepID=A0A7L4ZE80_9FLAO|nr:endonuclease [Kordia antarctica]QHI34859.1 Extracellular ribonuclease [Kordia antarctica]
MKQLLLWLFLAVSITAYAQVPSYYNDVNLSQSGTDLKDDLATKIISTHTTYLSYTPGVWNALEQSDVDPNNNSDVILIYGHNDTDGNFKTDRTRDKYQHGGSVGDWNREHVFAKSLADPALGTSGAGADAHNLRPCDMQQNSSRNNRKFGTGSGVAYIVPSGDWYPGDEWKGDTARMIMFMYLRYGNRCLPTFVGTGSSVSSDNNMIDLFLQWNVDDPVSAFETQRNGVIANIQGNRNPFVDNPAFATQIWGGPQAEDKFGNGGSDTQAPTVPQSLVASNTTTSATTLNWAFSTDNTAVTSYEIFQNSVFIGNTANTTYNVSGLSENTSYTFTVTAKDAAGNTSSASSGVTITTTTGGGNPGGSTDDLFFSEYIEGSSNNKALEIANFTGSSVNLSIYTIKKQTNGAGSWSSAYALSGNLNDGNVYVIANSSANSTIQNQADVTTGGAVATFNGNDPVGLFKNNVLIDIIGTFNGGSSNFAQNVTLVRKSSVTSPNTNYAVAEWDSFATDTFSNLGTHSVDGGSSGTAGSTTVLHEGFFESGLDGWVDGGSDCYRYSGSNSYEGNYSIRLRDNSGTKSSMTLNDVDVSPYDEVEVEFYFYSYSMETGEDFWLRYYNGSSWQTVRTYVSGTDFQNNNFFSSKVTLSKSSYNFVSDAKFRFQADASANADQIYIDQVTITGIVNASARMNSEPTKSDIIVHSAFSEEDGLFVDEDFTVYPNPVRSQLQVKIFADATAEYQIHSLLGQVVKVGTLTNKTINVANLKAGIYILQINDGDEILTKKFIKQ